MAHYLLQVGYIGVVFTFSLSFRAEPFFRKRPLLLYRLSGMRYNVGLTHSPISLIKAHVHRWYLPLISPSVRTRRESYCMLSMCVSGLREMNRMQRVRAHSHWSVSREVWLYVMPRSIDTSSIIRFIATCLDTWQFVYPSCERGKWINFTLAISVIYMYHNVCVIKNGS